MGPLPYPHRATFLASTLTVPPELAPAQAHLARLLSVIVFDHLVRHRIVTLGDHDDERLVDDNGRLLDAHHPRVKGLKPMPSGGLIGDCVVGGRTVHVEAVVRPLPADPDLHGVVLTTRDVSARVEPEGQLAPPDSPDPGTGPPDRPPFADRGQLVSRYD